MKEKSESEVAQLGPTLSDPVDCSLPGYSVHGFSRQEYWSGVPLPFLLILYEYCTKFHYESNMRQARLGQGAARLQVLLKELLN